MLDNLEEGIIIIEETSNEILYYNEAATGHKHKRDLDMSFADGKDRIKPNMREVIKSHDEKLFAMANKSIFNDTTLDT